MVRNRHRRRGPITRFTTRSTALAVLVASGLIAAIPAQSDELSATRDGSVSGTTDVGSPENQPAGSAEIAPGEGLGITLGRIAAGTAQVVQTDDRLSLTIGAGLGWGLTGVTSSETGVPPSSNVSLNAGASVGIGRFGLGYSKAIDSLGRTIETFTFPGQDGQFAFGLNSTSIVTVTDNKTGEVSTFTSNSISQGKSAGFKGKFGAVASALVNANLVFDKFTGKIVVDEENLRSWLETLEFRQIDKLVSEFKTLNVYDLIDQTFDAKKAQELRDMFGLGPIPGPEPSPFRSPPMPEPNPLGPAAAAVTDKASLVGAEVAGGPGSALGPGGISPADPSSPAGGAAAASGGHTGSIDGDASNGVDADVTGGPDSSLGPGGTSPADPSSPAGGAAAASGGHTDSVSSDASEGGVSDGGIGASDASDGVGAGESGVSDGGTGATGDSGPAGGTSGAGEGAASDAGGMGSVGGAPGF
jgi:hypothetical protein